MINVAAIQDVLNQEFAPVLADQLNNRVDIIRMLPKSIGSGKNIAWDVRVASNHVAASYTDGATINSGASVSNTKLPAILQWKNNKAEFSLSGSALAIAASSGPAALSNLMAAELRDATRDLAVQLATQIYSDGTGNSGADINGFLDVIKASGSYATINQGTYSAFRGNVYANSGTPRALTKALMDIAERDVFKASGFQANVIITTAEVYTKYENLFDATVRTDANGKVYNLGAQGISYKGIPVIRDSRCPAGMMFMLTMDCMELVQLPPLTMSEGMQLVQGYQPIMDPEGNVGLQVGIELLGKTGDKIDGFIKIYSNLRCTNPNRCAVIKDLAES